ncbi:MAG TPA: nuclear transport factor 2 family protein [Thermoanaerobaculaceae bacterium]|nr:nuclear transport factor 2 family protein [Thermoanaerobaculaceae bacterium]
MSATLCCAALAFALTQEVAPRAPGAEIVVMSTLEELRKGEMFLDASALEPNLAASFTVIEEGARVAGSFAYLEPIRRLRERGGRVTELKFDQTLVRVYGGSAVATYRYTKSWTEGGVRHHDQGWSSDVFELREDGVWLLILRHRGR